MRSLTSRSPDAEPASAGFDVEKAKLGHGRRLLHEEHRVDDLAVLLRDPATLSSRIKMLQDLGDDLRD